MTEQELRAYALAAVTARLSALDRERADLLALLTQFGGEAPDDAPLHAAPGASEPRVALASATPVNERRRRTRVARPSPRSGDLPPAALEATAADDAVEAEAARVLPRRGRLRHHAAPIALPMPTTPTLPPMPRLIKARVG